MHLCDHVGEEMKELTLILPDSVDIVDVSYYWRSDSNGLIKSLLAIDASKYHDGDKINCYKPLEENKDDAE